MLRQIRRDSLQFYGPALPDDLESLVILDDA